MFFVTLLAKNSCTADTDCSSFEVCENLSCEHKKLFPNLLLMEIGGFIVFFIFSIVTTIAGNGGGTVFLPILMLMYNFST